MAVFAAIDVDGTLETAGGAVRFADISKFVEKGHGWGVLSSRSVQRSKEALSLDCEDVYVCRVDMRAEELIELKRVIMARYPDRYDNFIYVADRQIDQAEAFRAAWYFCFGRNFARFVELV